MDVPEVRYAKTPAGVHVAYLVVGAGAVDLLWPGVAFSNIDVHLHLAESARFLQQLGSIARLITFDPRGTGLSDRISDQQLPTLETRMADAVAVMEAAESTRTALLGSDATGPLAILFAATYPERTSALILYSTYASGRWSSDYPWAWREDEWDSSLKEMDERWGEPAYVEEYLSWLAPSAPSDPETIERFSRRFRAAASPGTAVAMERMERETDVRENPSCGSRPDARPSQDGQQGLRLRGGAIPGGAHLGGAPRGDGWGGSSGLVRGYERNRAGDRSIPQVGSRRGGRVRPGARHCDVHGYRWLDPARFPDGRSGVETAPRHPPPAGPGTVGSVPGREVDTAGDGFLATFDGPARAIRCAMAIAQAMQDLGLQVRVGLHTGEIELEGDAVRGIAVHIGARVASLAGPGEVLVSNTVKDLVAGSGLTFEDRGEHELKGVRDRWRLYQVLNASP